MRTSHQAFLLAACIIVLSLSARAQTPETMAYAAAATSKFISMPGLPTCMTISIQNGDPGKGPSVILGRLKAGCVIPWHWHTPNERLMIVSGTARGEMKGGKALSLKSGDFALMPSKDVHQFTALTAVELFDISDAPFDIHYVDTTGTEIPADQALMKPASAKPAAAH